MLSSEIDKLYYITPQENASQLSRVAFCEITVFSCFWKAKGNGGGYFPIFLTSLILLCLFFWLRCTLYEAELLILRFGRRPTKVLQTKAKPLFHPKGLLKMKSLSLNPSVNVSLEYYTSSTEKLNWKFKRLLGKYPGWSPF